jgi:hypothetical protein
LRKEGDDVARHMIIDDFHLTDLVPGDFPEPEAEAVRQVLNAKRFLAHLRGAIHDVLHRYAVLSTARGKLSG